MQLSSLNGEIEDNAYNSTTTTIPENTDTRNVILGISFNILNGTTTFDDVPLDGDFYWLLTCLFLCIVWFTFVIYYNSRIFGFLVTRLLNHVLLPRYIYPDSKSGVRPYVHVGSLSITFLSGKIMFRDFIWITPDYSMRVQDGWLILRWWVPYVRADIRKSDFTQSETRLHALFNGFEFHLFNRSETYARLLQVFGIHKSLDLDEQSFTENIRNKFCKSLTNEELIKAYLWRDFFPVTKLEINSGRFVFGNYLLPTTLLVTFEEALINYSSKPAFSKHDLFTHIAKCKAQSFKIILANSPKYTGLREEPPRFMGEGFVIFQSNNVDIYYYQDEPGFASSQPEKFMLSTNDVIERFTSPAWGLEMKSGKGTDLRYGPWADRQREALYNFFYPADFLQIPVDERPREGSFRIFQKFDFKFSTMAPTNIDILFADIKKETNVMHLSAGPGSYLEVSVPMVSQENGYASDIVGTILHLDSSTTLPFRSLAQSETLEFRVRIEYPRMWNHHQVWTCEFTGSKTTAHLLFEHKLFFQALIDDWAGNEVPDLLKFVPYTCKINLQLREFEIILLANEYNWVDCSGPFNNENCEVAVCGDTFELAFELPFHEYLPPSIPFKIWIQGESLEAAFHVPETSSHYSSIKLMHEHARLFPLPGYHHQTKSQMATQKTDWSNGLRPKDLYPGSLKWRNIVQDQNGWFTCWSVPVVALSIAYRFHPVPPRRYSKRDNFQATILRDQEILDFNPRELVADQMEVELEIGPSNICLYGYLLRALWNIKENYMGESQSFTDFASKLDDLQLKHSGRDTEIYGATFRTTQTMSAVPFDERLYRPFAVTVSIVMHELHGHLIKSCYDEPKTKVAIPDQEPLCSFVYLDRLCFEMDKNFDETKLQLILSPVTLHTSSPAFLPLSSTTLNKTLSKNPGFLHMTSLQFRGHASFSELGRPLSSETLEYSWLVEVEIGKICGQLSIVQLFHTTLALEQLFVQMLQEDGSLQPPLPYRKCLHDRIQTQCPDSDSNMNKICPYSEDVKYKMVRLSIRSIDLQMKEKRNTLLLNVTPVKFSTCNLHSCNLNSGLTLLVNCFQLRHLIDSFSQSEPATQNPLLEVMNIRLGPIFVDSTETVTMAESYSTSQKAFLAQHDARTKRLWFLWPEVASKNLTLGKCGCVGGCAFFGSNLNGSDFFNLRAENNLAAKRFTQKKNIYSTNSRDFLYGESLLKPGEPVVGFTLNSIYEELEDCGKDSLLSGSCMTAGPSGTSVTVGNGSRDLLHSVRTMYQCKSIGSPGSCRSAGIRNSTSFAYQADPLYSSNHSVFPPVGTEPTKSTSNRHLQQNALNDQNRSLSETGIGDTSKKLNKTKLDARNRPINYSYNGGEESDKAIEESEEPTSQSHTSNNEEQFKSMPSIGANKMSNSYCSTSILKPTKSQASLLSTISAPVESKSKAALEQELKETEAFEQTESLTNLSSSSFCSAVSSVEDLADNGKMASEDPFTVEDVDVEDDSEQAINNKTNAPQSGSQNNLNQFLFNCIYPQYLSKYKCENCCVAFYDRRDILQQKICPFSAHDQCFSNVRLVPKSSSRPSRYTHDDDSEEGFFPGKVFEKMADLSDSGRKESFQKTHRRQDSSEKVINLGKLEKQISKTVEFHAEKVTVLIKVSGTTSVRLSPPSLEGLSEFLESLAPTLQQIHPLAVLNHMHLMCVNQVGRKNVLKKQKTLEYGQMKIKAFHSTLEREQRLIKQPSAVAGRGASFFDTRSKLNQSTVITANQYEETRSERFQLYVQISNVDLCLLQTGFLQSGSTAPLLVNTFEGVQQQQLNDSTCVSLFAVRLDSANFDLCNNKKERRSLHTFITNNAQTPPTSVFAALAQKDLVSRIFSRKPKKEQKEIEPLTIETQELLQEETIAAGNIGSLHMQLNRLKASSSLLDEAILTIIPSSSSKVNFDCVLAEPEMIESGHESSAKGQVSSKSILRRRQDMLRNAQWDNIYDTKKTDKAFDSKNCVVGNCTDGFIMFEAGVEEIKVNAVKKQIIIDDKLPMNKKKEISADVETEFNATTTTGNKMEVKLGDSLTNKIDAKTSADKTPLQESNNQNAELPLGESNAMATYKNGASSFVAEIGIIWFNFAAPPKTSNTKKIDYTCLDWHLISTANPSISAWIASGDLMWAGVRHCLLAYEQRLASTLVCLMSNALEMPGIHIPPQSKFITSKLTPFARSLHEDPSCQLMNVLRRYLCKQDPEQLQQEFDDNLASVHLPPLKLLKKGLVSLSRQWKNALYMPLLVEQNIRNGRTRARTNDRASPIQKTSNIPLRLLINENAAHFDNSNLNTSAEGKQQQDVRIVADEVLLSDTDADETTNLLHGEPRESVFVHTQQSLQGQAGSKRKTGRLVRSMDSSQNDLTSKTLEDALSASSSKPPKHPLSNIPAFIGRSARGSLAFPMMLSAPLESLGSGVNRAYGFLFSPNCVQNEETPAILKKKAANLASSKSLSSLDSSVDLQDRLFKASIENCEKTQEQNLYAWTRGQHEYIVEKQLQAAVNMDKTFGCIDPETKHSTLCSAVSDEDQNRMLFSEDGQRLPGDIDILPGFVFVPTGIHLGDVRIIFEPLFASLCIQNIAEDSETNIAFEQLGPKISLSLSIKLFKIELVESDSGASANASQHSSSAAKKTHIFKLRTPMPSKSGGRSTFTRTPSDPPAFDCARLMIGLDLRKVKDFLSRDDSGDLLMPASHLGHHHLPHNANRQKSVPVGLDDQAMPIVIVGPEGGMNEITTVVNFNVDVNKINQKVNLPLLRLLHQAFSVFQNVKETRDEIRSGKHPNLMKSTKKEFYQLRSHATRDLNELKGFEISQDLPKCWKNMYYLLDLYETTPETKTIPDRNSFGATNNAPTPVVGFNVATPNEVRIQMESEMANTTTEPTINLQSSNNREDVDAIIDLENEESPLSPVFPQRRPSHDLINLNCGGSDFEEMTLSQSSIPPLKKTMLNVVSTDQIKHYANILMQKEFTPLIIYGVAKIRRVNLEAKLSGLKLDGELNSFHISFTHKEKVKGPSDQARHWNESSLTAQLSSSSISLLEELEPDNRQTIVKVSVGKSHSLLSAQNKMGKDLNSALLSVGAICIHIPQHPVALHGVMTRSSRQLSTTLEEFKTPRIGPRTFAKQPAFDKDFAEEPFEDSLPELTPKVRHQELLVNDFTDAVQNQMKITDQGRLNTATSAQPEQQQQQLIKPITVQFTVLVDSLKVGASLLPSLSAQYYIGQITSSGLTGAKAGFTVEIREHLLSFNTRVQASEVNLPSSASVSLPAIHVHAEYMEDATKKPVKCLDPKSTDGIVLRKGSYLNALAEIGSFEHCLTTDLLNHLLLVQKVFMKEINEILQKMSGFNSNENNESKADDKQDLDDKATTIACKDRQQLLFNLVLRMKGVQITATTPTNSAVRLETGQIELELSNRVQNMNQDIGKKLFAKLQMSLNVALGQLFKNPMFEEADPEFQQLAYFRTFIVMRNALQDELIASGSTTASTEEKEAVLITLRRPLLYLQPIALDKAVLVWLNYKNAYEYWNEQRAALNTEVLSATQEILNRIQSTPSAAADHSTSIGAPAVNSTLFLQLTVDDLGICLPITVAPTAPGLSSVFMNRVNYDNSELKSAFVITLESSSISACSSGSWVSKAKFTGLCIRFADDFETSLDDWKPDANDPSVMNLCVVSEGTYEICSKTTTPGAGVDAKWILNVAWRMEGFDIHVDVSIGKQLSSLFKTLTALAGEFEEEEEENEEDEEIEDKLSENRQSGSSRYANHLEEEMVDHIFMDDGMMMDNANDQRDGQHRKTSIIRDTIMDAKKRSRLIEKELNEQVRLINELKASGASQEVIEQEIRRFNELESFIFNDFKRDIRKKLRRQSVKSSPLTGKKRTSRMESVRSMADEPIIDPFTVDSTTSGGLFERSKTFSGVREGRDSEFTNTATEKQDQNSSFASTGTRNAYGLQEPNIDFELDVKIFFNSGKCVLHTKETVIGSTANRAPDAPEDLLNKKSGQQGNNQNLSINRAKGNAYKGAVVASSTVVPRSNYSSSKLRAFGNHSSTAAIGTLEYTVFLIPGLDIKLHYSSKTAFPTSTGSSTIIDPALKRLGQKKASCFAWMTLHSIPEETLITPHLLDFLEQALEPIPLQMPSPHQSKYSSATDLEDDDRPEVITSAPAQYAVYGSFPVDVIVYLHVQPSVLRFSCLPLSRVECLLQLPSVDLVFSSKRAEEELGALGPDGGVTGNGLNPSVFPTSAKPKLGHRRMGSDFRHHQAGESASVGGLSVTGYLADFSLYIFHPYTNKKAAQPQSVAGASPKASSPKTRIERKDSLSLQVEFVKINISRTRKLVFTGDRVRRSAGMDVAGQKIVIRFSGLCDMGSASFKYDIRRLSEILAFPKAWYRKVLWKRVFLGEQGVSNDFLRGRRARLNSDSSEDEHLTASGINAGGHLLFDPSEVRLRRDVRTEMPTDFKNRPKSKRFKEQLPIEVSEHLLNTPWETLILFGVNLSRLCVQMNMGNVMGQTSWLTRNLRSDGRVVIDSTGHRSVQVGINLDGSTLDAKGGIVGGQIELSRIDTKLNANEYFGKEPQHVISLKADALETRIDYMGTSILMFRVSSFECLLKDEWKIDPNTKGMFAHPTKRPALLFIHCALTWDQLQLLMSRSTTPDLLKIVNKLEEFFSQQFHSGRRMLGSLHKGSRTSSINRHSLHRQSTMTSNATTGSTGAIATSASAAAQDPKRRSIQQTPSAQGREGRHHRHWQKALRAVAGQRLATLPSALPAMGTILGGTFELNGNNISLACFAGVNFRSKSWAVFSLRHPHISFATEAQDILDDQGQQATHIVQNFSLGLGRKAQQEGYAIDLLYAQHSSMATVCRISRSVMFAPQYRTVHEWFSYAFGVSDLDEVHRFPQMIEQTGGGMMPPPSSPTPGSSSSTFLSLNNAGSPSAATAVSGSGIENVDGIGSHVVHGVAHVVSGVAASLGASLQSDSSSGTQRRYTGGMKATAPANHKEIIFALPSLQMELKTEHVQPSLPPTMATPRARVDCAFVTDFDDHIFVAVDVEAYFFLHDLISSYIKEKESTGNLNLKGSQSPLTNERMRKEKVTPSPSSSTGAASTKQETESNENDWRDFVCQTWHLEPTVRLLSWAGKNIEPYGVDYILQRLGFTQARVTIPKWIQRGAMDPFDKVLAELMYQIVVANNGAAQLRTLK